MPPGDIDPARLAPAALSARYDSGAGANDTNREALGPVAGQAELALRVLVHM